MDQQDKKNYLVHPVNPVKNSCIVSNMVYEIKCH
jgi:hypothetical protein